MLKKKLPTLTQDQLSVCKGAAELVKSSNFKDLVAHLIREHHDAIRRSEPENVELRETEYFMIRGLENLVGRLNDLSADYDRHVQNVKTRED